MDRVGDGDPFEAMQCMRRHPTPAKVLMRPHFHSYVRGSTNSPGVPEAMHQRHQRPYFLRAASFSLSSSSFSTLYITMSLGSVGEIASFTWVPVVMWSLS